jgi:hypothetical protein
MSGSSLAACELKPRMAVMASKKKAKKAKKK